MSTTVQIPGGTAILRDPGALAVKHRRPLQLLIGMLGPQVAQTVAREIQRDGVDGLAGLGLSLEQLGTVMQLTDATVFALLESWTLDAPLPRGLTDVGDMDTAVYDALTDACVKVQTAWQASQPVDEDGQPVDTFSVAAIEDLDSPTGACDGSSGRSAQVVRRTPSDRRKPSTGRSTGTGKRSA